MQRTVAGSESLSDPGDHEAHAIASTEHARRHFDPGSPEYSFGDTDVGEPELPDPVGVETRLGRARVSVVAAEIAAPGASPEVASTPEGTSSAITGAGRSSAHSIISSTGPRGADWRP